MALLRLLAFTWMGRAIVGLVAIAVVGATLVAPRLSQAAPPALRTAAVTRGNVTQAVSVSGAISASASVKAAFKPTGRIAEVFVKVGDPVQAGTPLARLDTTDLAHAVRSAEVNLLSAQAKYDATVAGASAEDMALARNALDSAQLNAAQAERNAANDLASAQQALEKLKTSYASAKDNAVALASAIDRDATVYREGIGQLGLRALGVRGALEARLTPGDVTAARNALVSAELGLAGAGSLASTSLAPALAEYQTAAANILAVAAVFDRAVADGRDTTSMIATLQAAQTTFQSSSSRVSAALDAVGAQISAAQSSTSAAYASLTTTASRADPSLDQPRIDTAALITALSVEQQLASSLKARLSQVSAAIGPIGDVVSGGYASAVQAVAGAQERVTSTRASQEIALRNAQVSYSKALATPKPSEVTSALASLQTAQIGLDKARADLEAATLRAPVAGVVQSVASQIGEAPANPFAVIAAVNVVALHGTIGEAEVAKVKVGQVATVAVDAVGSGTRLTGRVTGLDPVATLQQGVPVYGIDITIDRPDPAVRPGMTGTATVIIQSKQGVLTVPNSAIRTIAGRRTIQVLENGQAVDGGEVVFGISNDTVTEVVSGLEEGRTVVLPQPRTTTTAGQGPGGGQVIRGAGGAAVPGGAVPIGR